MLNDIIATINAKVLEIKDTRESLYELFKKCDDPKKKEHYMEALHLTHDAVERLMDAVDELKGC